jgi:hypothetical protein
LNVGPLAPFPTALFTDPLFLTACEFPSVE